MVLFGIYTNVRVIGMNIISQYMKNNLKHSLSEELIIFCILPASFAILLSMFGVLGTIFVIILALSSGVIYFITRWLWFDRKNRLGIGLDEYTKKNNGKFRN